MGGLVLLLLLEGSAALLVGPVGREFTIGRGGAASRPPPPLGESVVGALTSLSEGYAELSRENYLAVASLQSCIVRSGAATAAAAMSGSVDPAHIAAIGTIGLLMSGGANAAWLRHLEGWHGSQKTNEVIAKKAASDYFMWAPVCNSAYLLLVPLLTSLYAGHGAGMDLDAAVATWKAGFPTVMAMEACIFAPYNLCAFRLIPPTFRPQTATLLAATFTVGLSGLC